MTHAAEELHVAQPSLSKAISRLEEDLGVHLFDRIGRQIKLNKYGSEFLLRVDRIFLELEDGKRSVSDLLGNKNATISIAHNNLYPYSDLIEGYLKLYPNTRFQHASGPNAQLKQLLLDGSIDFFIASPPIEDEHIESLSLAPLNEEIFLVVPLGHKFANRINIELKEAANEPFICMKEGFGIREITDELFRRAGFNPNIVLECEVALNILDFVNANMGVALLPILQWRDSSANIPVALHITEPVCNRKTSLCYLRDRPLSEPAKQYRDYLINYFRSIEGKNG